jgi:hypothetical protein
MKDLIKWLSINAIPEFQIINHVPAYYWCLRTDAEDLWDGILDDRLKWYTNEEMLKLYKDCK